MLRLGIIGVGRIGKVHCRSIAHHVPNAKVKAVADLMADASLRAWAEALGIHHVYNDYRDILKDNEIDGVLICSSTDTHASIAVEAARAGKHIFCEKPVDHNLSQIRQVMEEVCKAKVKFQVGFNRRFDNNFKAVREAVVSGKIGQPHIIRISSRDPEPPPISYVKVSGGIFMDMTIHDFDMIRYLSGSEAIEVYAVGCSLVDPAIGEAGDIDTAVITIKLANGAIATIDNSRKAAYGYDQRAEVFGSLGSVSIANNTNSTAVVSTAEGVVGEKPLYFFLERYMQSFADEMTAFVNAVIHDTETPVTVQDGLAPVLIGLAARRSLLENRPVKISEIGED